MVEKADAANHWGAGPAPCSQSNRIYSPDGYRFTMELEKKMISCFLWNIAGQTLDQRQ